MSKSVKKGIIIPLSYLTIALKICNTYFHMLLVQIQFDTVFLEGHIAICFKSLNLSFILLPSNSTVGNLS